jgi:hypothetical protein
VIGGRLIAACMSALASICLSVRLCALANLPILPYNTTPPLTVHPSPHPTALSKTPHTVHTPHHPFPLHPIQPFAPPPISPLTPPTPHLSQHPIHPACQVQTAVTTVLKMLSSLSDADPNDNNKFRYVTVQCSTVCCSIVESPYVFLRDFSP